MTPVQTKLNELRARQSRERGRMAELAVVDTLSDELRAEFDNMEKGTPDLERQIRAATAAVEQEEAEQTQQAGEAEPDAQLRERIELRARAQVTNYLRAGMQGRVVSGAEAELNSAAGVSPGSIPLELWDTKPTTTEKRQRETRATTDAPGTVGVNLDSIRPAVFAQSVAARLGIEMPRVESGTFASATITASQSAGPQAKSAAAVGTAGAFTVTTATPKRISARLEVTLEDIAAVGQANFESILRENLALVLSDALDNEALNGTYDLSASPPNLGLIGIFSRLDRPHGGSFGGIGLRRLRGVSCRRRVDGLWANDPQGRVDPLVGPATYQRSSARTFQTATNYKGEMSASAYAMMNTGGFWTNKRMPDSATFLTVDDVQQAIMYRMGRSFMNMAEGYARTAVCPHWNEISIDDIYSGSASAERYFTMHVLLGDVILVQPAAYAQIAFRVA